VRGAPQSMLLGANHFKNGLSFASPHKLSHRQTRENVIQAKHGWRPGSDIGPRSLVRDKNKKHDVGNCAETVARMNLCTYVDALPQGGGSTIFRDSIRLGRVIVMAGDSVRCHDNMACIPSGGERFRDLASTMTVGGSSGPSNNVDDII
jgi:hypothetical protein